MRFRIDSGIRSVQSGMIRGAADTAKQEDELEEAIVLEILQQDRGERKERGEREEWNQHVGWHRKEDVGLRPNPPNKKEHPANPNHHRKRGMEHNVAGEKQNHHGTHLEQENHRERKGLLRKRKHDRTTDLRENPVLDGHGDEHSKFGFLGLLPLVFLMVILVGFLVGWNKRKLRRILGRRRIRTRSTKGRTL